MIDAVAIAEEFAAAYPTLTADQARLAAFECIREPHHLLMAVMEADENGHRRLFDLLRPLWSAQ